MGDRTEQLLRALEKFIRHVDKLSEEDDPAGNGFHREYRDLREIAINNRETIPAKHGKLPHNIRKNRYKDIVPFDETRVILNEIPGLDGSDYINANYILDAHQREGYVASQGPLPHTLEDFWRMIEDLNVKVVMMACKEIESGKKKCAKYWVDKGTEMAEFGPYQIDCIAEEALADDCIERHLRLMTSNGTQDVFQYHYTGWPDHGIPDDIDVILAMIKRMRDIRVNDKDHAPVVVHCSAGCGRTGTICAIDYAWEILKSGQLTSDFSLFEIVKTMREQRQSMIQTPEQYEMAHLAVKELFQKHIEIMNESDYANVVIQGDAEYSNAEEIENADDTYSEAQSTDLKKLQLDALDTIRNYDESPEESGSQDKMEEPPSMVKIEESKAQVRPKVQTEKIQKEAKNDLKQKVDFLQQKNGTDPVQSYDNVFTGTNYENVNEKGNKNSETTQNDSKLRNSFEQKQPHTVSGPKFAESAPASKERPKSSAATQNSSLPPTVPRTTLEQQSAPISGPQFITAKPHPPVNEPISAQSGPKFVDSSPIQQPKQQPKATLHQQPPMEGRFVSVINVAGGGSSTISQGNKSNQANKLPNSDQYELAKNVEPSRNSLQNVTLNSDASAVYAVPGKSTEQLNSGQAGAVYSEVSKGGRYQPMQEVSPRERAYESIAPTSQLVKPAPKSKHYEEVAFDMDYSTVGDVPVRDDGPPLPKREYNEPETHSDTTKSSVTDKLKNKITSTLLNKPFHRKSLFHGKHERVVGEVYHDVVQQSKYALGQLKNPEFSTKNTSDHTDPKSNSAPGFNQRIEKKVKGPRQMPWSKTKL